jgi:hypothetical protein
MPVLDRQPAPAGRGPTGGVEGGRSPRLPDRLPETTPTPLQRHYINLSAVGLLAGAVAITAVEGGMPLTSPLVKLCVLIGAPILVLTTADAALRFWRSAWAWMPINVGRGIFRLTWVVAALLGLGAIAGVASVVLLA